jgi:hypothetical protein
MREAVQTSLVFAMAMMLGAPAFAARPFDGMWTVVVTTEKGACPQVMTFVVAVQNGAIENAAFKGLISNRGSVYLAFGSGSEAINAQGKERGLICGGVWRETTEQCAGHWKSSRN